MASEVAHEATFKKTKTMVVSQSRINAPGYGDCIVGCAELEVLNIFGVAFDLKFIFEIHLREKGGWIRHILICWSNKMVAMLLCYNSTVCTSKGDISASAICYLRIFLLVHYYID